MRRVLAVAVLLAVAGCGGTARLAQPPEAANPWSPPAALPSPAPPPAAETVERPDGTAIAIWPQRLKGPASRVLVAERDAAGRWGAGAPIGPDSPTPIHGAQIVVDPAGEVTAVWTVWDRPSGEVFAFVQASRRDPAGGWGAPVTLSRGTNGLFEVLAVAPARGRVVVVWSGSERRNGSYFPQVTSARRAPGGRWTFSRVAGRLMGRPSLSRGGLGVVGDSGRVRLIWLATPVRGFPGGILTSATRPDGRWSAPRRLSEAGERPVDLVASGGGGGTMTAVWRRRGTGAARLSQTSAAGWRAPRTLPGGPAVAAPVLTSGPGGAALVALERRRGEDSLLQVVRVAADGTVPAAATVARRPVPPSAGPSGPSPVGWNPALAIASGGRALVAWPRSSQRGDGVVVSTAIDVRAADPSSPRWGRPIAAVGFPSPVVGVLPSAHALGGDALQLRWSTGLNQDLDVLASTWSP